MSVPSEKLLGLALILIVSVSAYLVIVEVVNTFKPDGILESFSVKSLRQRGSSGKFLMGATFVVEAGSGVASAYDLKVQTNSSLVFESELAGGSPFRVQVPLVSPAFTAGEVYTLSLDGFVLNSPIPGARFTDYVSYTFEVASVETVLGLVSTYDQETNGLYSCANLTDADGYPVVGEVVDFSLQLKSGHSLTDGWISMGSRVTDSSGIAVMSMGFPFMCQMAVKACHEGNANFGLCERAVDVEVTSNLTESLRYSYRESVCGRYATGNGVYEGVLTAGTVSMGMNTTNPFAFLPVKVTASYVSDSPLNGTLYDCMFFYLDSMNAYQGWSPLVLAYANTSYVYEATWLWLQGPNATGVHNLIGGVVEVDSVLDISLAVKNGTGVVALGDITLSVSLCPSDLAAYFPEAACGDVLPVTVAFSKPRTYMENDGGGFTASSLATQFAYDGVSYAVDEPVNGSVPVSLYVNDTLRGMNVTDWNGLATFSLQLNPSEEYSQLSIRCVADGSSFLLQDGNVIRNVVFTKVNVNDSVTEGSGVFKLSCTVNGQGASSGLTQGTVYIGTTYPVDLDVELADSTVWNAPVSVLIGKPITRTCTNSSGWVSTASGSSLLRVACLYDINTTDALASTDINHDGKVDTKDTATAAHCFGSMPGTSNWNWRADINFDMIVDVRDVSLIARYFGKNVNASVLSYTAVNANFIVNGQVNQAWLDGSGCVSVPAGATGVSFAFGGSPVGAVAEFFNSTSHQECCSDNAGKVSVSWVPQETGSVGSGRMTIVALKPYFALAWLPSSLQIVTSQWSNVTDVSAQLSAVTFLNVGKRPVNMTVDFVPNQPTIDDEITVFARCYDFARGEPASGLVVNFYLYNLNTGDYIHMGDNVTDDSGVAALSWSPSYYSSHYSMTPCFVLDVVCNETAFTLMAEVVPVVVDARFPTVLQFLGDVVMNVVVGVPYDLSFKLTRADTGAPVPQRFCCLAINGSSGAYYQTDDNGVFTCYDWIPSQGGVYFIRAMFYTSVGSDIYKSSNETDVLAVAEVVPVAVLFDVQPREFAPGTSLTLTATVLNATSSDPLHSPLHGYTVTFYQVDADGSKGQIGQSATNASGVACYTWPYTPGVHAYTVGVGAGQQMITSPVVLTVAQETSLSLNVGMGSDFNCTLSGNLTSYGEPMGNRTLKVYVNGTLEANVTTMDYYGNFCLRLSLPSVNYQPTLYNVQAVFEGDSPCNATAYATTPNGTQYAVCTTIQYGYKPSSNTTMLTVKPTGTDTITATKTSDQLQKEAQDSGWFTVEPEFSWWFPWFRLHFKLNVNLPRGNPNIDYGWSLLPFGESYKANNLVLANTLNDASDGSDPYILADYMVGVIIQFGTALLLGCTPLSAAIAIGIYAGYSSFSALRLYLTSNRNPKAWLIAFISSAISGTAGLALSGINSASSFLTSVSRLILGKISSIWHSFIAKALSFFTITGITFAIMDFAFMVFYLSMYFTSI